MITSSEFIHLSSEGSAYCNHVPVTGNTWNTKNMTLAEFLDFPELNEYPIDDEDD